MIYGLVAAVAFGVADFLTAIAARRIGAFVTLVVVQVAGTILVTAFFLIAGPSTGAAGSAAWLGLILTGALAAAAYYGLYRGLELGPIALVSPIVAADAAIAIILVAAFLHESLSGAGWVGVGATLAGVILASTDLRELKVAASSERRGIPWALFAMVVFGVVVFIAGWAAKRFGWFLPLFTSRIGTVSALGLTAGVTRGRSFRRSLPGRFVWLAVLVGVVDIAGFAAFTRGSQVGLITIVTAASAVFPLIPIAGGMVLFGERPAPTQLAGAALVVGGLLMLGLTG